MFKNKFKLSVILVLVPNIGALLMGIIMFLNPEFFLNGSYLNFTGQSLADLSLQNRQTADFISILGQEIGAMSFVSGILGIAIAWIAFRNKAKWAWYVLFTGGTVGYFDVMAHDAYFGNYFVVILTAFFLLMLYAGLILGWKEFKKQA
jgi:hypothetical protein